MRRSYKFLLRPTCKQVTALEACLEDHRQLYNAAMEERREAWRMRKASVIFYGQSAQLPAIRAADLEGQGRWSATSQQQTLRRLEKAFTNFFRRLRAGSRKPGFPRFKGRDRFDSVLWLHSNGAGCKWDSVPHPTVTRVYFKGIGHVRVHQHRAVKGRVKSLSVKREAGRWWVIVSCDNVSSEPLEPTGASVGIDLGIRSFLTTSNGEHVPNQRLQAAAADRIAGAQRVLARKKRGSKRRRKAKAKVTKLYVKVRRTRLDHAHKTALTLVRENDVIVHEALQIQNLTRRPKPLLAEDGSWAPNGVARKLGMNRSILDAGWGVFLEVLRAKAEEAGRVVIEVDARRTSQRCARCGHVAAGNRVTQAAFRCLACGHQAHADVNAAVNILRAGLALQANAA